MPMKNLVKQFVRVTAPPLVRNTSIDRWPGWLGRTLGVKVPQSLVPQPLGPTGSANVNILCELIDLTSALAGDIADCGVFVGGSTVAMGLYLRQHNIHKTIYGFDSFEGFEEDALKEDLALGGEVNEDRRADSYKTTSFDAVSKKISSFGLRNIQLIKGYFHDSFRTFPRDVSFSFVHMDVNIYSSYKECLEYFYPRVVPGGIILFDEYNDPPWPGCNKAVDEFTSFTPEKPQMIERNNYQKWYLQKMSK
jgi:O-methyltransferase